MAEKVEEIAELLEGLKQENEINAEDFTKLLTEIKSKIEGIQGDNAGLDSVAGEIKQLLNNKFIAGADKFEELGVVLERMSDLINTYSDNSAVADEIRTLSENFKSGFESVVNYANNDAEAKNLLLEKLTSLENAVNNGAMVEVLRHRTDELVKGYENFVSDANLRHGNMVSAIVDLRNTIDDYSSKTAFMCNSVESSLDNNSQKILDLESTVSSNLSNVNSKLYSMGDDVQKTLNDGFEHLKYLSSNLSEYMNSNSLEVKTILECLRANVSEYSEHIKEEFSSFNADITQKIADSYNMQSADVTTVLHNIKGLEDIIAQKSNEFETSVSDKFESILEYVNTFKEAVLALKEDNESFWGGKLNDLADTLQSAMSAYEKLLEDVRGEINSNAKMIADTSENLISKLSNDNLNDINRVKDEVIASAGANVEILSDKINDITNSLKDFTSVTAGNLSEYLSSIKELFVDFSNKVETSQYKDEIIEKIADLELSMNKSEQEQIANIEHLTSLLSSYKNALDAFIEEAESSKSAYLKSLEDLKLAVESSDSRELINSLEILINQKSNQKDEKLLSISEILNAYEDKLETLTNNLEIINISNNSGIAELRQLIRESLDKDDFISKIENLFAEKHSTDDLKFNEVEDILNEYKTLISQLSLTLNNQESLYAGKFVELKDFIENSSSKEEIIEKIQDFIDEKFNENDLKFDDISSIIEDYSNSVAEYNNYVRSQNDDILMSLEDLRSIISESSNLDEVVQRLELVVDEKAGKNEKTLNDLRDLVSEYKNSIDKLSGDIRIQNGNTLSELEELKTLAYDLLPKQTSIDNISELINNQTSEYTDTLSSGLSDVKNSIQNIIENIKETIPQNDSSEILGKISALDMQLSDVSLNYEQSFDLLNNKLREYVEISEKISTDTNAKLDISINEFETIRLNFEELSNKLTTLVGDSGLIEILANIRQQFNVVLAEIKNEKEGGNADLTNVFNSGIETISSNLYLIGQNLEEVRIKQGEDYNDLISMLETNISDLKSNLEVSAGNINEIINSKIQQIYTDFEPVKNAANNFLSFNFADAVTSIKEQIEISYINILSELSSSLDKNSAFEKLEASYKDSVSKLSEFEDFIRESVDSNLESINDALTNISNIIQTNLSAAGDPQSGLQADLSKLEAKIQENKDCLKTSFTQALEEIREIINKKQSTELEEYRNSLLLLCNNDELMDLVRGVNKTLADSIEKLSNEQTAASQDILDVINSLKTTVDSTLEVVREKFEGGQSAPDEIIKRVDTINAKLDVIAMAAESSEIIDSVNDLNDTLQHVKDKMASFEETINDNLSYKEVLQKIAAKLDGISEGSGADLSLELTELKEQIKKFTNVSESTFKLEELVRSVDNKLDVIAMSDMSESTESELQDLKEAVESLNSAISSNNSLEDLIRGIDNKLDVIVQTEGDEFAVDIEEIKDSITSLETLIRSNFNLTDIISAIDKKLDIIVQTEGDEFMSEIGELKDDLAFLKNNLHPDGSINELISGINNKLDIIAQDDHSEIVDSIEEKLDSNCNEIKAGVDDLSDSINGLQTVSNEIKSTLTDIEKYSSGVNSTVNELSEKTGAMSETLGNIHSVSNGLENKLEDLSSETKIINEKLDNIQSESVSGIKLEDLINTLHNKVDILAMSEDNDVQDEIIEIKELLEEQISMIKSSDNGSGVNASLQKLLDEINKIDANISGIDFSQKAKEIKESIISAVVSVTNEISFVEETEEIKDFVNERTNELHKTLMDVKHQLSSITNTSDDMDVYTYTLQDVESDLAKLRLGLNDLVSKSSVNEICVISNNINRMAKAMDDLRNAIIETEIKRAESGNMNDHILSISSRINQLLLSQKEVDKAILEKLDDNTSAIKLLDNTPITSSIEKVLVAMDEKLSYSANLNTVLKNVMMYLGEWMDGTTETLSGIYDKTSKASNVKEIIKELRFELPQNHEMLNRLEERFNEQELRLDRLEKQLDRMNNILAASKSESDTLDRIDKIDEKLARLSVNIEKLASYVE